MSADLEHLKKRIPHFVETQPGYDKMKYTNLEVSFQGRKDDLVILGVNEMEGMGGMGNTLNLAYDDFVRNWNELNGFEWIKKNR